MIIDYDEGDSRIIEDSTRRSWKMAARLLRADKETACRVLGWSMSPFLSHNDIIWLRPVRATELRFGDVVLYDDNGRRIVHRFLRRKKVNGKEVLIIKGDAIAHNDPPIPHSQLLAKVVRVDKRGLRLALETRQGRLLNVTIAALSSCPGLLSTARGIWRFCLRAVDRRGV